MTLRVTTQAFLLACTGALLVVPAHADAQAARPDAPTDAGKPGAPRELPRLMGYVPLLEKSRLIGSESASAEELEALLAKASEDLVDGHRDEASEALYAVIAEPRYSGLADFPAYHTAELLLSSLLTEDHALSSAQRIVDRMLQRGPAHPAYASAFRRGVDIAIKRGDYAASAAHLGAFVQPSSDSASELAYLRGLAAYETGDTTGAGGTDNGPPHAGGAARSFGAVTKGSRFYANAQYMLGAIAARDKRFSEAEKRFCSIANSGKNERYPFFIDGRFFPVRDLSMLGLGRVAHESARSEDAFYYYFQVPNDSPQVSEALFEAAWASYEGRDHDTAVDSLDQLDARFPRSPRAAEAAVLRGYVHLARCEFAAAEKALLNFEHRFAPVLSHADAVLASPTERAELYRALQQKTAGASSVAEGDDDPAALLLSLVETDPDFARLASQLRALEAELARASHVPSTMRLLAAKLSGKERPSVDPDDAELERASHLRARVEAGEAAVSALSAELTRLARAGADKGELKQLRAQKNQLDVRMRELARRAAVALPDADDTPAPADAALPARLEEDARHVMGVRKAAFSLRAKLESARDERGVIVLGALRERLADELRRSRIGRVDAVMGAKRKVELEVESLSAGRLPPELRDSLQMQTLLRDDEEYWPFEGDDWPDEFEERYSEEDEE